MNKTIKDFQAYKYSDFNFYPSTQIATAIFNKIEGTDSYLITLIKEGHVTQFESDNEFNTSSDGNSSSVYLKDDKEKVVKISTFNKNGETKIELKDVSKEELLFFSIHFFKEEVIVIEEDEDNIDIPQNGG